MEKRSIAWWKRASVYQIYPLSFQDSNGDGIGDIPGILSRLDHLQTLGIDVIWLSPVFTSPMKDNGYDISDYSSIHPWFGTKEDLKKLVDAVHARGMKIISDIVLNHTSDQHPWFIDAINNPKSPYRDYYIFRKQPNDIQSVFSGPAWSKVPNRDEYYFHFFAKEQPDLNWQNPQLRQTLYRLLKDWLAFGFDGFRLDVIDLIGKDIDAKRIGCGPHYQTHLEELKTWVFHDDNLFTVGELSGSTPSQASLVTGGPPEGVFSMAFQFSHLALDEQPQLGKWALRPLQLKEMQATFQALDDVFSQRGWNALFMGNHDQPRSLSRYGSPQYHYQSQTMLFLAFFGQRGTPFIYQGEEIGMMNYPFTSLHEFRDIESIQYYQHTIGQQSHEQIMQSLKAKSRDNARTPMQWNDQPFAGFSSHSPWLPVHPLFREYNVEKDRHASYSIQHFLSAFLMFRKHQDVFIDGTLHYRTFHEKIYAYERRNHKTSILILTSFSEQPITLHFPDAEDWTPILTNDNHVKLTKEMELPPFFGGMYQRK